MIRAAQYHAAQDTTDLSWGVYMKDWNADGAEYSSCIQTCKDKEAAEKATIKWQTKENKGVAVLRKEQGAVFLLEYLCKECNYTGTSKDALKFAKRYLSSEQIENVQATGKSK